MRKRPTIVNKAPTPVWKLTEPKEFNPLSVSFKTYNTNYMVLSSPTAPCTVEGITFDSPDHIVVVTVENARSIWRTLHHLKWNSEKETP